MKIANIYVADFETGYNEETEAEAWVWAAAIKRIVKLEKEEEDFNVNIYPNIHNFMKYINSFTEDSIVFFHNLKFDGYFIVDYLLKNGYKDGVARLQRHLNNDTFKNFDFLNNEIYGFLDNGAWYSFYFYNKLGFKVKFKDSAKIFPMKLEQMPKTLGMPESLYKRTIDNNFYNRDKNYGHNLSKKDKEYLMYDIKVLSYAISFYHYNQNMEGNTAASIAMSSFRRSLDTNNVDDFFAKHFPLLTDHEDKFTRKAYRGGLCMVNPKYAGKLLQNVYSYDVNSMYPAKMKQKPLPYGKPLVEELNEEQSQKELEIFSRFEYEKIDIQFFPNPHNKPKFVTYKIKTKFILKPDKLSIIPTKGRFGTKMINEFDGEFYLTHIDLFYMLKIYDFLELKILEKHTYETERGLFDTHIDNAMTNKLEGKREKNQAKVWLAKLDMNSLYGKFGMTGISKLNTFNLKENNRIVDMSNKIEVISEPMYVPMACAITAYARETLIVAILDNIDNFVYCDTDSVHVINEGKNFDLDKYRLGAWDLEKIEKHAKYIRPKTYMYEYENDEGKIITGYTAAGAPIKELYKKKVSFDEFKKGFKIKGKLIPKVVEGGVFLKEIEFSINH